MRAKAEIVDGEFRTLAPQHGRGRLDQALDRDLLGVVVAADEIVFREGAQRGAGSGNPSLYSLA